MQAVVQDTYGSAEVMKLQNIDKPAIADDEVLIRVARHRSTSVTGS
jgi:NADPH:quinone reductase-like Zn-dependent oxidoreductase